MNTLISLTPTTPVLGKKGGVMSTTKTTNTHAFTDTQDMHQRHPRTFEVPTEEELEQIQAGDLVKVTVEFDSPGDEPDGERFWVVVTGTHDDRVWGTCGNVLVFTDRHGIDLEDLLYFEKRHCYDVILRTKTEATCLEDPEIHPVDKSEDLKWKTQRDPYGIDLSFSLEEEKWPAIPFNTDDAFRDFQRQLGLLSLEDVRLRSTGMYQLALIEDEGGVHLLIRVWDCPSENGAFDILFPNIKSFLKFQNDFRNHRVDADRHSLVDLGKAARDLFEENHKRYLTQ